MNQYDNLDNNTDYELDLDLDSDVFQQVQDNSFKLELNEPQQEAVNTVKGPLLVIAGAGSGKTRVITARIVNLIQNHGAKPESILALTFTNKAAQEMKERILKLLPNLQNLPFIGTFHSYCLRILKKNQLLINLENFTILDSDDQTKIVKLILSKYSLDKKFNANQVQYQISMFKNSQIVEENYSSFENPIFREIFLAYEKEKRASKSLDFDDLLVETVKLFKKNQAFKENFQSNVKHVLVDEYQDTNHVQHELLKEFTKNGATVSAESICAVGDEDQSIYSWRGATVENILNFKKDFPGTALIKIEQNYRSVNQILKAANNLIENNRNRNPKKLWSDKVAENRIAKLTLYSAFKEGDMIASFVKTLSIAKPEETVAVLYRTHFQSRTIEEALLKAAIPYKIIGGIQFYERKEIKDILAYLKLIVNPFDRISFFRVLNCPTRNLGKKSEEIFYNEWEINPFLDFKQIAEKLVKEEIFSGKKAESLLGFVNIFKDISIFDSTSKTIKKIIEAVSYITYLRTEYEKSEYEQKIDNIGELIRAAEFFEQKTATSIENFLEEVALMQEKIHEQSEQKDLVQLMSLHAAKGLEFDNVIISGLEEGLLPSSRSLQDPCAIEEERRLLYVGITRARERLILSNAQLRNTFGQTASQLPSRFLSEIPKDLVWEQDCAYWNDYEFERFFKQFMGIKSIEIFPAFKAEAVTFGSKTTPKTHAFDYTSERTRTKKVESAKEVLKSVKSSKDLETWKANHIVTHDTFGAGIIKLVEEKPNGSTIVTVQFKTSGLKKLDSKFLKII